MICYKFKGKLSKYLDKNFKVWFSNVWIYILIMIKNLKKQSKLKQIPCSSELFHFET